MLVPLTIPPASDPSLVGVILYHAYVVVDFFGSGLSVFASNATSVTLAP